MNSVNFAGSEVLAGVGRKCCAKSFKRLCKDHQDLHSSIDCHNGIGAEQVYCTLEDNTSDCCDGKLQSHWDSDDGGLTDGMEVNFPFFFLECEDVVLLFQIDEMCIRDRYIDYLNAEISKYIVRQMSGEKSVAGSKSMSSYYIIVGNIERIGDCLLYTSNLELLRQHLVGHRQVHHVLQAFHRICNAFLLH